MRAIVKIISFDTTRHLDHPKVVAHYLAEAFRTRDSKLILRAVRNVAQAMMKKRCNAPQTAAQLAPRQYRFALKRNGVVRRNDRVRGAM
jgi:DNA-binding phage protein